MKKNAAVVLAAGKGSRFRSGYKLLTPLNGEPLIRRTLRTVLAAGFDEVFVVTGAHHEEMARALADCPVTLVRNPEWEQGQSTSLKAGMRAVGADYERTVIFLGDQPYLKPETVALLLKTSDEYPEEIIVPVRAERRGNPIVVPARYYEKLIELTSGDSGGKLLLKTYGFHAVPVDDSGVLKDIDTIEDIKMQNNFWKLSAGEFTPIEIDAASIADTQAYTPEGAYTTFRTYDRMGVLNLTKHFNRLEETSALAGFNVKVDREKIKAFLADWVEKSDSREKRIRLTVDLKQNVGDLYIAMEPLHTPAPEFYEAGIVCLTAKAHRENPKAKLSRFLNIAEGIRQHSEGEYQEIIMIGEDGNLLEGLSSNFYGVIGGTVYTANEGVLSGTTRDFILRIASEAGIPVVLEPIPAARIPDLDESFISSTSRSVLPIRSIDGTVMHDPAPGPVTKQLMTRFNAEVKSGLEYLDR